MGVRLVCRDSVTCPFSSSPPWDPPTGRLGLLQPAQAPPACTCRNSARSKAATVRTRSLAKRDSVLLEQLVQELAVHVGFARGPGDIATCAGHQPAEIT